MSRSLRIGQKFLVIFLLAVLPSLILLGIGARGSFEDIRRDQAELAGLDALQSIFAVFEPASLHQGLTGRALTGDGAVRVDIEAAERQMDASMAALSAHQSTDLSSLAESLNGLAEHWKAARAWQSNSPQGNFDAHSGVIAEATELLHQEGGDSGLLLDPDANAYFEIVTLVDQIPKLRELVAQSRGGLAMLEGSDQEIERGIAQVQARLERTSAIMRRIDTDLHLLGQASPDTLRQVAPKWDAIQQAVHGLREDFAVALRGGTAPVKAHKVEYFDQITAVLAKIQGFQDEQFRSLREDTLGVRLAGERRAIAMQIASGVALVTFVSWLVAGFARDITRRILAVESTVQRLGAGDFTQRMDEEGADEVSSIAQCLNRMSEGLGRLLTAIQTDAREVLGAAIGIGNASSQVARAADEQAITATQIAATFEQLGASIHNIATSAIEANDLARSAGEAAKSGSEVIGDTVSRVRNIAVKVDSASSTVAQLGQQASTISGIADVIKGIADQTNLLALNAAIEAARAGDMGRGFAVVADEVRSLAERTSKATREIGLKIASIQMGADQAVAGMASGVSEVQSGVAAAEKAGKAISAIELTSVQVIDVASAISLNLKDQTALARDVTGRVESIARTSEEYSTAAASTAAAADQLRAMATDLEKRLSAFRFERTERGLEK
jgi:methyl-accepting chemotaxis protein